jgi:phenylacetate-CoA ligase
MNPFLNPVILSKIVKSYLFDVNRIWHASPQQMKAYRDKCLRQMVRYAYTVPLYHTRYKICGIHPQDIKGTEDLKKLPFITKDDLRQHYPDGIVPSHFPADQRHLLSTSGSTGKPVFLYHDLMQSIRYLEGFLRVLKVSGGQWSSSKICLIVDLKPGSVENVSFERSIKPFLAKFLPLNNMKYLDIGENLRIISEELNKFQPEFLGSDPSMLRELAALKNNDQLKDVSPRYFFSSGSMLDQTTRSYVEKAFAAKIIDIYSSTETGPMAFQCLEGEGYHVNEDAVLLEVLDKENHDVGFDTRGRLVVTRLFGAGTPIIRYTGLEDIVTRSPPRSCCGIATEMINHITGRSIDLIHLPNGKELDAFQVTGIPAAVMNDLNTYKIKQFQIVQKTINELQILVIIDEKLRNRGPSVQTILQELKERFQRAMPKDMAISVLEVNDVEKDARSHAVRVVVSHLK